LKNDCTKNVRTFLPQLAGCFLLGLSLCLGGCFTEFTESHLEPPAPYLREIWQTPQGDLALAYRDRGPNYSRVHLLVLNMPEFRQNVAAALAQPGIEQGGIVAKTTQGQPQVQINPAELSGTWHPALTESGVDPNTKPSEFTPWYADGVAVQAAESPLVWQTPSGPCRLHLSGDWEAKTWKNKSIEAPAHLLDIVTAPVQIPILYLSDQKSP